MLPLLMKEVARAVGYTAGNRHDAFLFQNQHPLAKVFRKGVLSYPILFLARK